MVQYKNSKGELHREDGPAIIDVNGNQSWYRNGLLHRLWLPAYINVDGSLYEYYFYGKLHRTDGPARKVFNEDEWWLNGVKYPTERQYKRVLESCKVSDDGCIIYYKNKKIHRDDNKPAKYDENGAKWYFQNGLLHRDNGPAIEFLNGYEAWFQNGKRHRTDGPAINNVEMNYFEYWLNGIKLSKDVFHSMVGPKIDFNIDLEDLFQ